MIKFSKMHGLGNDFAVIDATRQSLDVEQLPVRQLAHRYLGIGFDQLLVIEPSAKADFRCRIFNSDGNEAEQCGNGLRCIARFIHEENLSKKSSLSLETRAGIFDIVIHDYSLIQVAMGAPNFQPEKIPLITDSMQDTYQLPIYHDGADIRLSILSMGNPHAIMQVNSLEDFPVDELGAQIAMHSAFPRSANVGFMEIVDRENIRLRTFERGVGETFACGSNACAAVVAGIRNNLLGQKVKVSLAFGDILIEWLGEEEPVIMTGSATRVFDGIISL